jgi:membrane-associated protease RseP (regulator of RpoE activity)
MDDLDPPTPPESRFRLPPDFHEPPQILHVRREPLPAEQIIEQYKPQRYRISTRLWLISFALFIATCASTFYAGGSFFGHEAEFDKTLGLQFMVGLIGILLAHELGHFTASLLYRIPATPPIFIPMPYVSLFGTMGALIIQQHGVSDRKSQFDIGIAGPLAGLVIAIPLCLYALDQSQLAPMVESRYDVERLFDFYAFEYPPIMKWMIHYIYPEIPAGMHVEWTPLLFACWTGFLITALNLVPIGQLDGGHILYGLIGRWSYPVAVGLVALAIGYMVASQSYAYMLMLIIISTVGIRHPPTANDRVPLGWFRITLGWLTLAFLMISFTPNPIEMAF